MEVVVKDDQVDGIVSKIANELANPAVGGKIFVVDVAKAVDLATKEQRRKGSLIRKTSFLSCPNI